jgi:hypothetical protein
MWSRVPRDSDPKITALARASSNCKRQAHPLIKDSDIEDMMGQTPASVGESAEWEITDPFTTASSNKSTKCCCQLAITVYKDWTFGLLFGQISEQLDIFFPNSGKIME